MLTKILEKHKGRKLEGALLEELLELSLKAESSMVILSEFLWYESVPLSTKKEIVHNMESLGIEVDGEWAGHCSHKEEQ
jgi:hypothetical protein